MSKAVNRPNSPCLNEHCGNTLYTKDYNQEKKGRVPVWVCTNCGSHMTRQMRYRQTNVRRGMNNWEALYSAWKETDDKLHKLVEAGLPSGCILVYGRSFNFHLNKLLCGKKLSNFDLKYHTAQAKKELELAKAFVIEKGA